MINVSKVTKTGTIRKLFAALLTGAMLLCSAFGPYTSYAAAPATEAEDAGTPDALPDVVDVKPIDDILDGGIMAIGGETGLGLLEESKGEAAFSKKTGEVIKIDTWNNMPFIRLQEAEGGEVDFVIEDNRTVISNLSGLVEFNKIAIGDIIDVYYVAPLIITLQYPPRYTAAVAVILEKDNPGSAFVGIINENAHASDFSVILNISDDTPITRQSDGAKVAKTSLTNRIIIAYFAITTRSLPPQALVQKIVVLDGLGLPVFVNGMRLFDAQAYVNRDGVVMVPLRAVAEALGYEITWESAEKTARVGVATYVKIGSDEYTVGRAMPTKLDAAAELKDFRTYVPVSFFTSILQMELDDSNGLIMLNGKGV